MTLLDYLRNVRRPASVYHVFRMQSGKGRSIHAFFEGYDDGSFYNGFILGILSESAKYYTYECGSRKGVYEIYGKVMARVSQEMVALFFVDKDLSDIIGDYRVLGSNMYITEYYSIENYLCTESVLSRVARETIHVPGAFINYDDLCENFRTELTQFYNWMSPIMAWVVYMRRHSFRLNLDNVVLSRFFNVDDNLKLYRKVDYDIKTQVEMLDDMCGTDTPPDFYAEFDAISNELSNLHPKAYVRGKYDLWFFVNWFDALKTHLEKLAVASGGRIRTHVAFGPKNAIQILGPRCQMPRTLEEFLERNLPAGMRR